ncbi:NAD(P)H:quinone oxidoreductase [Paracraurococcus ruber]|uniref:NAD(P)H dehydrogenase (quinone) n=1 Tax=Paracraurococcus ruber TaxID=77675 RepID=A0ABS1D9L1_9PROT|nr:NAD(P)H:quinone oxidoreductase [Paracraurococcus ruber]MBK1662569.1 NAD(P)H:quinone oxidoreductase type IV [Paracraurococcus ruber]TDG10647.1 NAD(P)H:quinone oxidoreductase [Paracraurococcus ruber]
MARILVLYYSMYGHVETLAGAVAEGARSAGAEVIVKRVPDLVPREVAEKAGAKLDQAAPEASPQELDQYDAIILGCPTRYGRMAAQMAQFWDQTGGLWARGALIGKVGAAFTSTASQHGGQETTLLAIHTQLLHHGMVLVGLPYSAAGLTVLNEVSGGTPYGASTIAGGRGERQPSENELELARFQGRHVAGIAQRLLG